MRAADRRYRVGRQDDGPAYRVSVFDWRGEMLSCGHTTEWHKLADFMLTLAAHGRLGWAPAGKGAELFGPLHYEVVPGHWVVPGARIRLVRANDGSPGLITEEDPLSAAASAAEPPPAGFITEIAPTFGHAASGEPCFEDDNMKDF